MSEKAGLMNLRARQRMLWICEFPLHLVHLLGIRCFLGFCMHFGRCTSPSRGRRDVLTHTREFKPCIWTDALYCSLMADTCNALLCMDATSRSCYNDYRCRLGYYSNHEMIWTTALPWMAARENKAHSKFESPRNAMDCSTVKINISMHWNRFCCRKHGPVLSWALYTLKLHHGSSQLWQTTIPFTATSISIMPEKIHGGVFQREGSNALIPQSP